MKLGIKLPHSLELSLSATAKAVANQDVIIDTFVILCKMHDDMGTLQVNYYDDLVCLFHVKVLKKSLSLTVTCPQISEQTQFIQYQDGHWATIKITNKNSLMPVNGKDTVIELKTKLHCESFITLLEILLKL